MSKATIIHADCLEWMRAQPNDSVAMTMTSPPYEAARTYGIDFNLRGQAWVDWMVERVKEMVRITNGIVVIVCEGQTRQFRWSAAPVLLMADLHRAGIHLRKPPIFHRVGIPGSGGPDFWRNDYEFCIVASKGGKLAWSDNTANGHPPLWAPGGACTNRTVNGARATGRDKWGSTGHATGMEGRAVNGQHKSRLQRGNEKGSSATVPVLANAGNVIKCKVGGGMMGDSIAHENEAPYPESLCEPFIRCFCPPGGIVYDPFVGSGTTIAVALRFGRHGIGTDIRKSQVELSKRRIAEVQVELLP